MLDTCSWFSILPFCFIVFFLFKEDNEILKNKPHTFRLMYVCNCLINLTRTYHICFWPGRRGSAGRMSCSFLVFYGRWARCAHVCLHHGCWWPSFWLSRLLVWAECRECVGGCAGSLYGESPRQTHGWNMSQIRWDSSDWVSWETKESLKVGSLKRSVCNRKITNNANKLEFVCDHLVSRKYLD